MTPSGRPWPTDGVQGRGPVSATGALCDIAKEHKDMAGKGKVAVIGAGFYGSTTAQRLAEYDLFSEVVLTDIVEGKPEGLALDMNQSRSIEGFETKVVGVSTGPHGDGYEAIAGSDVV